MAALIAAGADGLNFSGAACDVRVSNGPRADANHPDDTDGAAGGVVPGTRPGPAALPAADVPARRGGWGGVARGPASRDVRAGGAAGGRHGRRAGPAGMAVWDRPPRRPDRC